MNKSEFMKLLGDRFEFDENPPMNGLLDWTGHYECEDGDIFFKEKDIFPKVFETDFHKMEIFENRVVITNRVNGSKIFLFKDEAIEFAKKIGEKGG